MKKLVVPKDEKYPVGWSYSAWGMFKCMYRYYCVRVLGMKETGTNPAMERGIMIHKKAEQYLKGNITGVPKELSKLSAEYKALKGANPIVEQFWGVDPNWKPMKWGSWAVMKMDAAVAPSRATDNMLWIGDHKTGREYPEHMDQGLLYSCIGYALFPKADGFEAEFLYTDQGYVTQHSFDRTRVQRERKVWEERGKEMLSRRKKWPKTPSRDNCRFCFLRADKGGPCKEFTD